VWVNAEFPGPQAPFEVAPHAAASPRPGVAGAECSLKGPREPGSASLSGDAAAWRSRMRCVLHLPVRSERMWLRRPGWVQVSLGLVLQGAGALSRSPRESNALQPLTSALPARSLWDRTRDRKAPLLIWAGSLILCVVAKRLAVISLGPAPRLVSLTGPAGGCRSSGVFTKLRARISGPKSWLAVSRGQFLQ